VTSPLIQFKDVTKRFGERTILEGVNLSLYEGEIATIIGKSGVGKSVLLKHIIGLLEPDEGEIFFRGRSIGAMKRKERKELKKQVSYMFQNNALFDSLTVFENIALPLREKTSFSQEQISEKVLAMAEQFELVEVTDRHPSQISGGMMKRVALARALITGPNIVLFDEPTTGLDPLRKNSVLSMIAQHQRRFGFTAILVSHDIPDVFFISNRIAIIEDGKIIFQGSPMELEQTNAPMVQEFISGLEKLRDELTGLVTRQRVVRVLREELRRVEQSWFLLLRT
jgi:phospholipid/cholesterol/gamma-HCH transport system ATP-binding protein